MSRLDRNECLHCGTKQVRTDGFPLCSRCELVARKKYHAGRKKGKFREIFKTVRRLKFNIDGQQCNLREAKKILNPK